MVIQGKQRSILCLHASKGVDSFRKALFKAHQIDEISGALESYPPTPVGKTLDGAVFVDGTLKTNGDIEVTGGQLNFNGETDSAKLKYKDVSTQFGE